MSVAVKNLPEFEVAYVRRVGSYFEPAVHWGMLLQWAHNNELLPPIQQFIGISLDNPEQVVGEKCRHDACVTIPPGFDKTIHHDVSFKKLSGGTYAVYSFYDTPDKLNEVYQYMYTKWLQDKGVSPDFSRDNLEFNLNNPAEDPDGKCKVDVYVPFLRV